MGKTHTLLHLKHLSTQTKGRLIPVYAVMPKRAIGFLELYRAIISDMPFDFLGEQLVKVGNSSSGSVALNPIFAKSPGVVNALLAIRSSDVEKQTVGRQWLAAQPGLSARDLRMIGVTYRIKTPEDTVCALTSLTRLMNYNSNPPSKLIAMLDEYQRIGELKERIRQEINSGLHTYFNENPNGLEIILSFSFGREDNVSFLLSDELRSRAAPETISLNVLTEAEAIAFMRDLLEQFRIAKDERWAYPLSLAAIKEFVNGVAKKKPITPRRLMLYANHVFMESQYTHGSEFRGEITESEVRELLADPRLGMMDTEIADTSA
jgi:hypothetical protein